MTATLTLNNDLNGIELTFDCKPAADVLSSIKELGFRWHNKKKIWYAKQNAERLAVAQQIAGGAVQTAKAKTTGKSKAKANKYGVKVGDIFYTSWGYEQTNVNFFQVIALVGESSVRIREVHPKMVSEDAVSGMSADRAYEVTSELLPPSSYASFVEDNENGDLKRVKIGYGGDVVINVGKKGHYQDTAYPYHGQAVYESWYY